MEKKEKRNPANMSNKEILEAFREGAAKAMKDPVSFYNKSKLTDEHGNFKSCE